MSIALTVAGSLLAGAALAGCGGEVAVYRDLPVIIDGSLSPAYQEGDPEITVGDFEADGFKALADGGELPIVRARQGGRWIHLGVRVRGVGGRAGQLAVGLVTGPASGTTLVDARVTVRPTPAHGWLELRQAQLHVPKTDPEVAELAGQGATLTVGFDAAGERAEVVVGVVLVDG